jgi:hypothetical protein
MERLDRVNSQIQRAAVITAEVMCEFVAAACLRLPLLNRSSTVARIQRLIDTGAWTEVALALIEIELPQWALRRLVLEDGKWFCSLSKQVNLPQWLDDTADATHEILPLAILGALLEARRRSLDIPERSSIVPQIQPSSGHPIVCDNFS